MEPTELGGRKDLVDRVGSRRRLEDFTALDEWQRRAQVREAAGHPGREKLAREAVAVRLIVGLAALAFMVQYLYHVFFLAPAV